MEFNYGFLFEKTGKQIKRTIQKIFIQKGIDITIDQWVILYELYMHGMMNQVELCQQVYKDPPTVTRIIELLEIKQLLSRKASSKDRRMFEVSLSELGQNTVTALLPEVIKFRKLGWQGLTEQDINHLRRITQKIEQNLLHGA